MLLASRPAPALRHLIRHYYQVKDSLMGRVSLQPVPARSPQILITLGRSTRVMTATLRMRRCLNATSTTPRGKSSMKNFIWVATAVLIATVNAAVGATSSGSSGESSSGAGASSSGAPGASSGSSGSSSGFGGGGRPGHSSAAPELDPTLGIGSLILLSGIIAVAMGRRTRQTKD